MRSVSWCGGLLSTTGVFLSSEAELRRVCKTCGLQQSKKRDALMTNKAGPHNTGYTAVWNSVSSPAPPLPLLVFLPWRKLPNAAHISIVPPPISSLLRLHLRLRHRKPPFPHPANSPPPHLASSDFVPYFCSSTASSHRSKSPARAHQNAQACRGVKFPIPDR